MIFWGTLVWKTSFQDDLQNKREYQKEERMMRWQCRKYKIDTEIARRSLRKHVHGGCNAHTEEPSLISRSPECCINGLLQVVTRGQHDDYNITRILGWDVWTRRRRWKASGKRWRKEDGNTANEAELCTFKTVPFLNNNSKKTTTKKLNRKKIYFPRLIKILGFAVGFIQSLFTVAFKEIVSELACLACFN